MKIKLVRQCAALVLVSLLLCACSREDTKTKKYGRFVMTDVMYYNSYFGLSSRVYNEMCRDDGELCIKCVNSNGEGPFCDLQVYDDPGTDYLLYADRRKFHLVNSASGEELECKNIELISKHFLDGVSPYWLDENRLIVSTVEKPDSSIDPNRSSEVGYEVQLGPRSCVAREMWSYPTNGYRSGDKSVSPDRKGMAWTAFTEKKCVLHWFYGDYVMHEKDAKCDHRKYYQPAWVGDHPELSDKNS
jgi:hypothetical protein